MGPHAAEVTLAEGLLLSLALMIIVMSLAWWQAVRVDNYSLVDAVWALSFSGLSGLYALFGSGWTPRRWLIFGVASLWSLRLGLFLARRIYGHHPTEDGRYQLLRSEYGGAVKKRFFIFFQLQALSVVVFAVPFLLVAQNAAPEWNGIELSGAALFLVAWFGEAVADAQAANFKRDPQHRELVCDEGLWRYSRHPNYFFESMIWWAFYLIALGTYGGAYTIYAPLAILFLLLKVTGVPPSEASSLRKRGDVYRDYQRRTSVFIPWFPKK